MLVLPTSLSPKIAIFWYFLKEYANRDLEGRIADTQSQGVCDALDDVVVVILQSGCSILMRDVC